jgi:hypothetical protein
MPGRGIRGSHTSGSRSCADAHDAESRRVEPFWLPTRGPLNVWPLKLGARPCESTSGVRVCVGGETRTRRSSSRKRPVAAAPPGVRRRPHARRAVAAARAQRGVLLPRCRAPPRSDLRDARSGQQRPRGQRFRFKTPRRLVVARDGARRTLTSLSQLCCYRARRPRSHWAGFGSDTETPRFGDCGENEARSVIMLEPRTCRTTPPHVAHERRRSRLKPGGEDSAVSGASSTSP